MYLEHFKIREFPFSLTPNPNYYCELPGHQAALNVLLVSLRSGEGFIKIVGEVGTGKTMLCRLLLEQLDDNFYTAYLPNPDLTPDGLRQALAHELEITFNHGLGPHALLDKINHRLLDLHRQQKQVVLLIDEAQTMSDESLEALRLFTNLETTTTKLLQVILFAQPELNEKLKQPQLRQLKQRITFSYDLPPISKKDLNTYLCHRLAKAGYTYGQLFSHKARKLLFHGSRGLPRLVNILSHKAMMAAYGLGDSKITKRAMLRAIADTEGASHAKVNYLFWLGFISTIVIIMVAIIIKYSGLAP